MKFKLRRMLFEIAVINYINELIISNLFKTL